MTVHGARALTNIAICALTGAALYITGSLWALVGLLFLAYHGGDDCSCEEDQPKKNKVI